MRRERIYRICQLVGWSLYAIIINVRYAFDVNSWGRLLWQIFSLTLISGIGLLLTHAFHRYIKRSGWVRLPLKSLIPRIVVACMTLAVVWQSFELFILIYVVRFLKISELSSRLFMGKLFGWVFDFSMVLLIWSLIYFGFYLVENYRKTESEKWRLELSVKDAELKALKSQMNPHFIFNCLNSIRALTVEDPERAQTVVTQLANILRYSLQSRNAATVTLEEELQTVSDYLALEATRLEDRLKVEMNIAPETLNICVPTMLIQTLVENGVKYGVAARPSGGEISLTSSLQDTMLQVQVTNTGQLGHGGDSTGLGLRNAVDRLKLLFGESATLSLESIAPDQVAARIEIPIRRNLAQS
jgi:histidine kinase